MSNTLLINIKATSEHFNVPYQLHTTIHDLIKYVCIHSTALSNRNPDHYYLTINNNDMLDDNRTIEETRLDQPNRFNSLDICIKTSVLMERILQSHKQFWHVSHNQIPPEAQKISNIDESINIGKASSSTNQQQVVTTTAAIPNNSDIDREVHILVCGGPKVGKSTLINALCGCPVAKVNTIGLDHCTQRTTYYQLDNIFFWDTPGIQEWSHLNIDSYINSFTQRQTPLCMFYCVSPISFTRLTSLDMLLNECICRRHIFCVLVVTNMFTHRNRYAVLEELKALLSKYVDHSQKIREEHGIWYFGQIGLCTMVNSQEYIIEDTNRSQPQQGINELILALTKSLSGTHQLDGWLRTIKKNRQFWLDKQKELYRLIEKPHEMSLSEIIQMI